MEGAEALGDFVLGVHCESEIDVRMSAIVDVG